MKTQEAKRRKIFTRIGAALLLGVSLFNLGEALNRKREGTFTQRYRNLRRREKEELTGEVEKLGEIAEKEARAAVKEELAWLKEEESLWQGTEQQQKTNWVATITRSAVVIGWFVTMGLFVTSIFWGFPFSLKKMFLSVLPGEPHLATLRLEAEREIVLTSEEIKYFLLLKRQGEGVDYLRVSFGYDPQKVQFLRFEKQLKELEILGPARIDEKNGKVILEMKIVQQEKKVEEKDSLLAFYFKPKQEKGDFKVKFFQEECFVKKAGGGNILGKTEEDKIRFYSSSRTN